MLSMRADWQWLCSFKDSRKGPNPLILTLSESGVNLHILYGLIGLEEVAHIDHFGGGLYRLSFG